MRFTIDSIIRCPFFLSVDKNLLCCEGFVDNTCMTTKFADRSTALQYISDNCQHVEGGSCPMAMNLFEKYRLIAEREEREEREWYEKLTRIKKQASPVQQMSEPAQKENRQF